MPSKPCAWCGGSTPCKSCADAAPTLTAFVFSLAVAALPQVDPAILRDARERKAERN